MVTGCKDLRAYHTYVKFNEIVLRRYPMIRLVFSLSIVSGLLVLSTLCAPAIAQTSDLNLPRLGDAGSDDFSQNSERRVGQAIIRELRTAGVISDDRELTQWINEFATPLLRTRHAQGANIELFLVRDRAINAFALPGGFIGINLGLIEAAKTEGELASVIGHEIGHITQRHIARQFGNQRQAMPAIVGSLLLAILAAKSNPEAAIGIAQLGEAQARAQLLAFSRDAEREADRVGLEMLTEAGFNAQGSAAFFQRLYAAYRVYDNNLPDYFRTHPLTTERMTDMQLRAMALPTRIRPDQIEFTLVKARLRALGSGTLTSYREAIEYWNSAEQLALRDPHEIGARLYGLAIAHAQLQMPREATDYLNQAAAVLPKVKGREHSMMTSERIRQALNVTNPKNDLVQLAAQARQQEPSQRVFEIQHVQALIQTRQWATAQKEVEALLFERRSDAQLWRIASEIYDQQKLTAPAHRAAGESLAAQGQWRGALEQMQAAQRAVRDDFMLGSIIDSRLKDIRTELELEKNDPIMGKQQRR